MFADDTNIFVSGKNIKTLFHTIKEELKLLVEWFKANKLSLNETKTLFHSQKQGVSHSNFLCYI